MVDFLSSLQNNLPGGSGQGMVFDFLPGVSNLAGKLLGGGSTKSSSTSQANASVSVATQINPVFAVGSPGSTSDGSLYGGGSSATGGAQPTTQYDYLPGYGQSPYTGLGSGYLTPSYVPGVGVGQTQQKANTGLLLDGQGNTLLWAGAAVAVLMILMVAGEKKKRG
jgi:hypothetical protein